MLIEVRGLMVKVWQILGTKKNLSNLPLRSQATIGLGIGVGFEDLGLATSEIALGSRI